MKKKFKNWVVSVFSDPWTVGFCFFCLMAFFGWLFGVFILAS